MGPNSLQQSGEEEMIQEKKEDDLGLFCLFQKINQNLLEKSKFLLQEEIARN